VRERERERRERESVFRKDLEDVTKCCKSCRGFEFVYDHCSGDTICQLCGRVQSESGLGSSDNMGLGMQLRLLSKPYDRLVHFQQRIAQLTTRDPALPRWFLRTLGCFLDENKLTMELNLGVNSTNWGKQSWIKIFQSELFQSYLRHVAPSHKPKRGQMPKTPSKLAIHWIQIRKFLGLDPWRVDLDSEVLAELRMRYRLVSQAFDQTLRKPGEGQTRLPIHEQLAPLSRKNIVNVNYTMAQLLRIVRPELWKEYAKFIPQLVSSTQPAQNNARWEVIVTFCRKHFRTQAHVALPLDWPYHTLTLTELNSENLFKFFV